jgi:uncharacterized protein YkwD
MRLSTRLYSSVLFSGVFLTVPALNPMVHAQGTAAPGMPQTAPAQTEKPASPVDKPGTEAPQSQPQTAPESKQQPAPESKTEPAPAGKTEAAPAGKSESAPVTAEVTMTHAKPAAPRGPAVETAEERRFVELCNEERRKRGLGQLTIDPLLIEIAREHSREMQEKAYFNHNSPTAAIRTPMDRYLKAAFSRPEYACVGENLFYCSIVDVSRGHNAFMNSPTHRDNVLFPRYEKIGVGIVKNERGEFWVTQMFLTNTDPQVFAKRMAKNK